MYVNIYIYIQGIFIYQSFGTRSGISDAGQPDPPNQPGVAAFGPVLAGVFALFGQETPDVAGIDKPGTEKAGKVLLVCSLIFLERPFFQVRTSQE